MSCPDANALLRYLDHELPPAERGEIEVHLGDCASCRAALAAGLEDRPPATTAPTAFATSAAIDAQAAEVTRRHSARVGQVVGETYVVERFIGEGGMGEVWEASHRRIHRRFAIKFIREVKLDEQAAARLRREAEITSRLHHPHIVEVVDFDFTDRGTPYIVMDLLKGDPLSRHLRATRGQPFDPELFTMVLCQAASGMQAAHDKGVVHRDLKPSNIFIANDGAGRRVKVLDFGISKLHGVATADLTSDDAVMGTPRYMAPELAEGKAREANAQTDIFSLGAILYEMLAGAPAFAADNVPSTLYKVVHDSPDETQSWRSTPKTVRKAILRALAKKPERRPPTMKDFKLGVITALRAEGHAQLVERFSLPSGDEAHTQERPSPWRRSPLWRVAALALLSLAIVATGSWLLLRDPGTGTTPQVASAPPAADAGRAQEDRGPSPATAQAPPAASQPRASADASGESPPASTKTSPVAKRAPPRRRPPRRVGYGRLTVQSRDSSGAYLWANVRVDGRARGQTTLTLSRLRAGYHRVIVERRGYRRVTRRVLIRRGKRTLLGVKLRRR